MYYSGTKCNIYNEDVFICGDLNSRTGQLLDYYESITGNDGGLSYIEKYELIVGNIQKRSSRDLTVNEYGSNLNFCKSSGYHIMNGRLDDICNTSDFTCYKENGASVVDYLICKPESMNSYHKLCYLA